MKSFLRKGNLKGFTLIELVIVMVILGILIAILIPRYIDLTTEAEKAAQNSTLNGIRAAIAIGIADSPTGTGPSVQSLVDTYLGGSATGLVNGVQVSIGSKTCVYPTYQVGNCTSPTTATSGQEVQCVGDPTCT